MSEVPVCRGHYFVHVYNLQAGNKWMITPKAVQWKFEFSTIIEKALTPVVKTRYIQNEDNLGPLLCTGFPVVKEHS